MLLLLLLLLLLFNGLFSRTTWVSRYQKGKTSLDLNEARDDGGTGCSLALVGPYAYNLLQTNNHTNISSLNFYRPDALPDAQLTTTFASSRNLAITTQLRCRDYYFLAGLPLHLTPLLLRLRFGFADH